MYTEWQFTKEEPEPQPWWRRMLGGWDAVRFARSLHLSAIAAFALAVVAMVLGRHLVATALFVIASVGFLAVLILQRRR